MLDKLERKLGRFAIPHLTTLLVAGQAGSFVLSRAKPEFVGALALAPERVLQGEVWRVVAFLFIHPTDSLIFIIFALYLLFLYGRALEAQWGEFRFNLFLLIGWLASVGAAFAVPGTVATNIYLMGSIFLAFAYLNPNFELLLFFILPVRIKWLAALTLVYYAYVTVAGGWQDRALIGAGLLNLVLFFGKDLWLRARGAGRRTARRQAQKKAESQPSHVCAVCGLTDLDDPEMPFRYCTKCAGKRGYCRDHLRDHEHVRG